MWFISIRGCFLVFGDEFYDYSFRFLFFFDFIIICGFFGRKMLRKIKKSGDLEGRMYDGGLEELWVFCIWYGIVVLWCCEVRRRLNFGV